MATSIQGDKLKLKKLKESDQESSSVDMKKVASIILGGGEGKRLYPLTLTRCKPAITFGGKYRLIDVPISNSIHAECYKIFVLTQFLSSSLHQHIFQTYLHDRKGHSSIEILTAEQKPNQKLWFQGTADAVRQNIEYFLETPVEYFLILSGDQLYNFNFRHMVQFAKETDADLLVAALPVDAQTALRMGILKVDKQHTIVDFLEKPQDVYLLEKMKRRAEAIEQVGISPNIKRDYLGSMGIYLFKRQALIDLLSQDSREDFGKHLIPTQVGMGKAKAFIYDGYWEDIGTIGTFHEANIALTKFQSPFNFYNEKQPLYSWHYDLPPAKLSHCFLKQSLICEGSLVDAQEISQSLLGPRSVIHQGAVIHNSYLMGNDFYHSHLDDSFIPQIGENSFIQNAIIDKNVYIGKNVQLINQEKHTHFDGENIFVREGIIIIPRGARLLNGFIF